MEESPIKQKNRETILEPGQMLLFKNDDAGSKPQDQDAMDNFIGNYKDQVSDEGEDQLLAELD